MQPTLQKWFKSIPEESKSAVQSEKNNVWKEKSDIEARFVELQVPSEYCGSDNPVAEASTLPEKSLDRSSVPFSRKRLSLKRKNKSESLKSGTIFCTKPAGEFQHVSEGRDSVKKVCGIVSEELEGNGLMSVEDYELMRTYSKSGEAIPVTFANEELSEAKRLTPKKPTKELSGLELPDSPTFSPRKAMSSTSFSPLFSLLAGCEEKLQTPCLNTSVPLFSTPINSGLLSCTPTAASTPTTVTGAKRILFHATTPADHVRSRHDSEVSFKDDISLSEFLNCSLSDSIGINQYLVLEVGTQTSVEVGGNGRYSNSAV